MNLRRLGAAALLAPYAAGAVIYPAHHHWWQLAFTIPLIWGSTLCAVIGAQRTPPPSRYIDKDTKP